VSIGIRLTEGKLSVMALGAEMPRTRVAVAGLLWIESVVGLEELVAV
jgi:hypothetical protein